MIVEHIKFNKTTETQGLQRKAVPFYEKKRWEINQEVENDSQNSRYLRHLVHTLFAQWGNCNGLKKDLSW